MARHHEDRLPVGRALADRLERSRERALGAQYGEHEVPTDVAITIVIIGALCSTIGWWVAPVGRADVAQSWYALTTSTLFWGSALVAAVGLYLRIRRGLLAALVCAMSFVGTVGVAAALDPTIVGLRWAVELVCALVFCFASAGALLLSESGRPLWLRPSRTPAPARRPPA